MSDEFDVVIIGAGLAGAASAWAATRRGLSVLVLEQFEPDHGRGSSHGSARIVRRAYGDRLYVSLTGRAFELWREVEAASGRSLLNFYGGLDFGPNRHVPTVAELLRAHGVAHEVLPAAEAEMRWPGMRFEGEVVFHPQAGTMDAAASVRAMLDLARAAGAEVRYGTAVTRVLPDDTGAGVQLDSGSSFGEQVRGRVVVVAAGGWVEQLAGKFVPLPEIRVTRQQVFHFPRVDPTQVPWPSTIHEAAEFAFYHLAGGRDGGPNDDRKIGQHGGGTPINMGVADGGGGQEITAGGADHDGVVNPVVRKRVVSYVKEWFPGLVPVPSAEVTCLYTTTPSEDFLIDRTGPLVVCSPCSGHGAKFAPLIGELTADLVTGSSSAGVAFPERFRLDAHTLAQSGAVSL
ncbi:MAG TPA: FAD-dependent oxidoreductase [Jatrophihabitans sp.]